MSLLLFSLKTQYLPLSSGLDGQQRGSDFRVLARKQNQTCAKLTAASIIRERWRTKGCWLWLIQHHPPSSTLYINSVDSPYPRKKDSHIQVGVTTITVSRASPTNGAWRLYPASSTSMEITWSVRWSVYKADIAKQFHFLFKFFNQIWTCRSSRSDYQTLNHTNGLSSLIFLRYWYLLQQSWPYRWMHFNHSRVFWLMPELQQKFIIHLSVWNWPASPCFALLVSMVPWRPVLACASKHAIYVD